MWLMKTLLTSGCINQRGAGHTHERADISKSARAVYEKLTDWVEKEKERERLEDEALEQRFE
ncbi:hypothetical protein ACOTJU_001453 [Escherichia coli]